MNKKISFMLSLCQKAGKIITGEENCERTIAKGLAHLIIIANDASDNTKKKFNNKGLYYNVPVISLSNREDLSNSIGKTNRPTIVIIDKNFSEKLISLYQEENKVI